MRFIRAAAFYCAVSTAFATCVSAADRDPEGPTDNIVVTGHLLPTTVPQISSSFSEIDRLQFEQRQSIFATDLLQDLPSLAVSRSGTFGSKTDIRVRGAEANQVMVMIDGIRANDLSRDDAFDFGNLTTYDIERIEVLRGPQSALYGSDANAGVINIVTRRADKPLDVQGFFEGGSFDTLHAGARIGSAGETTNVSSARRGWTRRHECLAQRLREGRLQESDRHAERRLASHRNDLADAQRIGLEILDEEHPTELVSVAVAGTEQPQDRRLVDGPERPASSLRSSPRSDVCTPSAAW